MNTWQVNGFSVAVGLGGVLEVGGFVVVGEQLGDQFAAAGHADLGAGDDQEGMGHQRQGDVPVPVWPSADLC